MKQSNRAALGDARAITDGWTESAAAWIADIANGGDCARQYILNPAMIARMEQTVRLDPKPFLRRIQAPVLLVWGEKDAMIPLANAADYTRNLHRSTLVVLPGLGHVPQEEAPARSVEPVISFLASTANEPAP